MSGGCVFCAIAAGEAPAHVVYADADVVAFLDLRPVFHGHTLVAPRAHHVTISDLPSSSIEGYFSVVQRVARAVQAGLDADGSFVGMNNVVSQSVPHLHTHVVPRKRKDGLRGFFWPRLTYEDEAHMERTASAIVEHLERAGG